MVTRELRSWQRDALKCIHESWNSGVTRTAVVACTGAGKSSVIGSLAIEEARAGGRTLLLAHRAELLDQLTDACRAFDPSIPVGRIQSSRNESRRPITVAMIQTLASEKRRNRLPQPTLVIVDECHRAPGKSYLDTLAHFGSFSHTRTLGVTATMIRGDKKSLGDVWQEVCYELGIKQAIEAGWLVRPRGRVVVADHMDLGSAKVSRGDYLDGQLGDLVSQDVDQIVRAWQEHAENRITIAFAPTVESAQDLANEFRAAGVSTGEVYGTTSRAERLRIYERLNTGAIRVMVNVAVATEGFDASAVSCVLMARPTKLPGLYQQCIGRALRAHPGKDSALVLDVVGTSRHQRLVTLIELHPDSEYNVDELDALPCEECGGARRGKPLTDMATFRCECPAEPIERDPDGGRIKLFGQVDYEDVDLFAVSKLNWLFTHGGKRFLPCGDRLALLWPVGELYRPGHRTTRGMKDGRYVGADGQWLSEPLELEQARQLAEEWATNYEPSIASRKSSWRRGNQKPSDKQITTATNLGIEGVQTMNKSRVSDEISIVMASSVVDR